MSDDFKVQVSVRTPGGSLINARGGSVAEVQAQLAELQGIAGDITTTEVLLAGAGAAASLVQSVAPTAVPAPAAVGGGAPPAYNPPAPATTGGPTPPSCPHGPRVWRTGNSARGPWGAYFCPTPKGTPGQCDPEWDRQYGK